MLALTYDVSPLRWIACKLTSVVAKGVYWSRLSGLRLKQVPIPELPTQKWVRLRPILGGICGTDFAAITQRNHPASILQAFSSLPTVLGHENVSIVERVGSEVSRVSPGDRVVVESSLSCVPRGIDPVCEQCASGRFTLCANFRTGPLPVGSMIGWNSFTGGSWAERFVAHESQLYPVPDAIDDQVAILVDPIAGGLHAVLKRAPRPDENVLVLGAGILGVAVAASIHALYPRAKIIAVVRHREQVDLMQRFGASDCITVGRKETLSERYAKVAQRVGGQVIPTRFGHQALLGGFDLVYDCVGTGQSLTDAMKYARSGGTVVEVGTSSITLVDTAPLWFDELALIGANGRAIEECEGRRRHTYEMVFSLIGDGKLDLHGLLTHRFPLEEYRTALTVMANRHTTGAIKVAFELPSRASSA